MGRSRVLNSKRIQLMEISDLDFTPQVLICFEDLFIHQKAEL